jgi:rare lipoprotein A
LSGIASDYHSSVNAQLSIENPTQEQLDRISDHSSDSTVLQASKETTTGQTAPIAKTYAHEISGREAVTIYVRNIPVATFLGFEKSKTPKASAPSAESNLTEVVNPSQSEPSAVAEQSLQLVTLINQLTQGDFDAEKIGVKWDKNNKQYVIHVDQSPLIAMNGNVILPSTTKDTGEDALQITNRLRRQMGNVKPLKDIEGRPKPPVQVAAAPTNVSRYQTGWASWYGPGFHGNLTASGARFNQHALTAAHRTLPFGTKLRVTNRDNGRSVVVTVTDRGPFIHDRVIDLSMGAAQAIGVSGVSPVSLDIVN